MLREYVATITQRGQVTIPAEVRRLLGAQPRGQVAFRVDGNEVRLVPVEFTLESVFGSVKPLQRPEDFAERSRAAKEEHVARVVRRMRER
jgi:antitoxin PrlF